MPNWNGIPLPEPQAIKIPDSLPKNFNWNSYLADPKGTFNKFKGAREVQRVNWRGYNTAVRSTKKIIGSSPSKKFISEVGKQIRTLKKTTETASKTANNGKKLWDKFLKKVPGKDVLDKADKAGNTVEKSGSFLTKFAPLIALVAAVGVSVFINEIQGWRADQSERGQQQLSDSISKTLGLLNQQKQRIDKALKASEDNRLENQRTRDRIYAVEKEQPKIRENVNNALYEVRQGRKILESKISESRKLGNDALYETRQNNLKVSSQISNLKIAYDSQILSLKSQVLATQKSVTDSVISSVRITTDKIQSNFDSLKTAVANIKAPVLPSIDALVKTANDFTKSESARLDRNIQSLKQFTQSNIDRFDAEVKRIASQRPPGNAEIELISIRLGVTEQQARELFAQRNKDMSENGIAFRKLENNITKVDEQIKFEQFKRGETTQQIKDLKDKEIAPLKAEVEKLDTKVSQQNVRINQGISPTEAQSIKNRLNITQQDIQDIKVGNIKIPLPDLDTTKKDVEQLKTKIKEREKVDALAIPKLDQILNFLPLIPARAANAIRPDIPTLPQIEAAAATGVCRTTQPGGCMGKALNDNANDIKLNNNNNTGSVLDAINTGANAALLTGQQTILARLGDQLPGGIGGKMSRIAEWLHLDRVLNLMIFAATVHNALMLSNDIGQTLLGAINNVLTLIGLKKEDGSAFDLGSVISGGIESFITSIIGADNYTNLKESWAKANRIYQASVNILNSFQGLASAILTGLEMTAGKVAKIGNALRKSGEVLESAYGWMNPQPKFNRVTQTLESLQQGASTIQMVTQAPLDIINATTELTNATTELTNAIKEDENLANKGKEAPEPDQLKAIESTAKLVSASLELADLDFDTDE